MHAAHNARIRLLATATAATGSQYGLGPRLGFTPPVGLTDRPNCGPRLAHSIDLSRGENRPDSWGEPARLGVIPWGKPAKLLVKNY
jgi:hypothetical protein